MNKLPDELIKEIQYINDKNNLKYEINSWINESDFKKNKKLIEHELSKKENIFIHDKEYYRNLIFFSKSENVLNEIDLEIVFCNGNKDLTDIWKYFKIMSSSAVTSDNSIGCIKIMLKDKITNKFLGILEIGCDIYNCIARDDYIGWNLKNKKELVKINDIDYKNRLSFIVNITCCIGLQPMSYNLNIGKLLVMTIFSKEVLEYFNKKRGHYYAGVSTFGIYGKSVQYDRLKEIKYIGETKGNGTCDVPIFIYENIKNFIKKYYPNEYVKRSNMGSSKMRILQFGLNLLGLNEKDILFHGKKRGIYFGYTSNESKDFFNGIVNKFELSNTIKPFNEIVIFWKNRWANQRYKNLLFNQRIKISYELKDFTQKEKKREYIKQYNFEKIHDAIWLKHKKEKNKIYYQANKDNLLEELKINLDNYKIDDKYINAEYLGGFFDADGSIYISKNVLFINFSQAVINVLLLIQKDYGGTLFKKIKRNENRRDEYTLRIVGLECKKILEDLEKYTILKTDKIKKGLEYINFINKKNTLEKEEIINFIRNNKKHDDEKYFNRINWKYIAGIFDGDGYVGLNYRELEINRIRPKFSISQKYVPNFLLALKNFLLIDCKKRIGMHKFEVYAHTKENLSIIYEKIKNYIIVKKFQYDNLIKIFHEYSKNINNRNNEQIKLWGYEIKNNKHQDINYELDIQKNNIISSMKNIIINHIDNEINNNVTKETYTKVIQSDKKFGLNNPNYGQHLSNEHALNISIGTTIAKRSNNPNLTNDKIREIYDLKDKIMQKDVAEKYGMNREIVRRIWNRLIIPTDDPDFLIKKTELVSKENSLSSDNLTFEQKTSLGKRSLSTIQYVEIILWKIKKNNGELLNDKKIFSTTLADYLTKIWNTKVTNDMIKNIWSGKTKLFDFEFNNSEISYEKYLEVVSK
jgi:hypothetical protein